MIVLASVSRRDTLVGIDNDLPLAVCRVCSLILSHPSCSSPPLPFPPPAPTSFQINTLPSYEHEARIDPKEGCAQASCHTGAVWLSETTYHQQRTVSHRAGPGTYPLRMMGSPLASPLTTLKILIVLSEEHVASRLP